MFANFADRLLGAIEQGQGQKGSPVCVGIDPRYDRLPEVFKAADDPNERQQIDAIAEYCRELLATLAPHTPAVKPQIACFERYGADGLDLYFRLVQHARDLGLVVIGDVKRNDIGSTADAYAHGHLGRDDSPDAITVNGYFGADGLMPFVGQARRRGRGVFVLVRTSNPSAADIQDFTDAGGKKFYEHIAEWVAEIGRAEGLVGSAGYSCVGAVVGATYPDEARRLREIMPQQIFLVPGYGAQGATAADCAAAFKPDGTGAIVNASRSVIYAHSRDEYAGVDWKQAVEAAAKAFAEDIRNAIAR